MVPRPDPEAAAARNSWSSILLMRLSHYAEPNRLMAEKAAMVGAKSHFFVSNSGGNIGLKEMNDDTTLLREYATQRSNLAFEELVRRHIDLVYSLALRKVGGDAHAAHDLRQAAFSHRPRMLPGLLSGKP